MSKTCRILRQNSRSYDANDFTVWTILAYFNDLSSMAYMWIFLIQIFYAILNWCCALFADRNQ